MLIERTLIQGGPMVRKAFYRVVYDDLMEQIQKGQLKVGDKLPSEAELENIYGFSKTPIRQALHKLEDKGYIYRLQGKGSFVANYKPLEHWTQLTGFKNYYDVEWDKISAQSIEAYEKENRELIAELGFSNVEHVTYLKRIRLYGGKPFVFMEHYVSPQVPLSVFEKDPTFVSAVSKKIKEHLQTDFSKVYETIEAVGATKEIANHLKISVGDPLLKIIRKAYVNDELVDYNIYYTITDEWKYEVEFIEGNTDY